MINLPGPEERGARALYIGAGLTALWLVMLLILWLTGDGEASGTARWVSMVAALMPLGLIWMAVGLARTVDALHAEAEDLRAMIATSGSKRAATPLQPPHAPAPRVAVPSPVTRPAPPPQPQRPAAEGDPRQTTLGLDAPDPLDLDPETIIRALNFPDGPDDSDAIRAMRDALRDPDHARLIRSAQDVVTLLAERDIYTDDLTAEPGNPAAWRRFADGQRGRAVSEVGAVHDAQALSAATSAMRGDEVFRDAVHHFLRLFDRSLSEMIEGFDDDQIIWLAQTRSARAFMLLARSAGLFGEDEG